MLHVLPLAPSQPGSCSRFWIFAPSHDHSVFSGALEHVVPDALGVCVATSQQVPVVQQRVFGFVEQVPVWTLHKPSAQVSEGQSASDLQQPCPGVPAQVPSVHLSSIVQALPSSQAPLLANCSEKMLLDGSHTLQAGDATGPACRHVPSTMQKPSSGSTMQKPFLQMSLVHGRPSSQGLAQPLEVSSPAPPLDAAPVSEPPLDPLDAVSPVSVAPPDEPLEPPASENSVVPSESSGPLCPGT